MADQPPRVGLRPARVPANAPQAAAAAAEPAAARPGPAAPIPAARPAVNPPRIIEIAPCENEIFYRKFLNTAPIFTGLMFRNLGVRPFNDSWSNKHIATMVYLGNYGRCKCLQIPHDPMQNMVAVMAELLGPYLSSTLFLPTADAINLTIRSVKELLKEDNARRILANFNQASWTEVVENQESYIHAQPYRDVFGDAAGNDYTVPNIEAAIRILYHMAVHTSQIWYIDPLDLIVGVTVSVAKRGTLSVEFLNKIVEGIFQDLGANINLDIEPIQTFYKFFGSEINDETIPLIQRTWERLIPQQALRLMLTVSQLAGSGLTTYSTIGTALRLYPTFNWGVISRTFPIEWENYRVALTTVGNNVYYGFRKELGIVKSTNFKSLGYIAKELLVRGDGRVSLNRYMGWARSIKFRQQIDQMILDFINRIAAQEVDIEDRQAPDVDLSATVNAIIEGVPAGGVHMFM